MSGFFPSGGGGSGGGNTIIQKVGPLSAQQATIDFTAIPNTPYNHLQLIALIRDTAASGFCLLTFNGDGGANYDYNTLLASGAAATSANTPADTRVSMATSGSGQPAGNAGYISLFIPGYALTTFKKLAWGYTTRDIQPPVEDSIKMIQYLSTNAISRITMTSATLWDIGSVAWLYGVT